jgi:sugar phosphate isomerase/epimerase
MWNWLKYAVVMSVVGLVAAAYAQEKKPMVNYAAQEKLGWKLAAQAYTFGRNGVSLYDTIAILKDLGIKYVELFPGQLVAKGSDVKVGPDMPADWAAEIQIVLKQADVKAVAYGVTGIPNDEAGARKLFEWAQKVGIETIVCEPGAQQFALLDRLANEYKMTVALHNHPKDSPYWNPDTVLDRSKDCSSRVGACADTGHWARSGLVPIDCLKKLKGRIIEMHFKDLNEMNAGAHDVPWGTGACDFKGMLAEIKRQGFKGVFSIEYEAGSGEELKANVGKCVQAFSDAATELAK